MLTIRRTIGLALLASAATACDQTITGPSPSPSVKNTVVIATFDPTLVTFNAASCSMTNASTGAVSCSWDISNPAETLLNLFAEALVQVNYDCVNPKNGRIHSSEQQELRTFALHTGVASASLTSSGETLPLVALINDYVRSMKKENACKGNQEPQSITWQLAYWDIAVVTLSEPLRMSCFASDDREGCLTGIGI